MKIKSITLSTIQMPLRAPFSTHLGTVADREAIVIEVKDVDGRVGYGEVVAFSSPWYTEETIKTSTHVLTDFLIPLLFEKKVSHPSEVSRLFEWLRLNHMAKAGLEMALWDLQAKKEELPLATVLGGTRARIPSGVVVGTNSGSERLEQIAAYVEAGYERVKVKINRENDYEMLAEIRRHYPSLPLMVDANSAYTLADIEQLRRLDEFDLLMIEQPLAHDDIIDHATLQREIATPICLDESIVTFSDARQAIELGSCKVINIKPSRVGGHQTAKEIHDYCLERGIDVWCGGMLEFGISRAHNIALASLSGFTIPGDISASARYWEEDIIEPEVVVESGYINVPNEPGIGYALNKKRLKEVTTAQKTFTGA